jgi:hypothetical protein
MEDELWPSPSLSGAPTVPSSPIEDMLSSLSSTIDPAWVSGFSSSMMTDGDQLLMLPSSCQSELRLQQQEASQHLECIRRSMFSDTQEHLKPSMSILLFYSHQLIGTPDPLAHDIVAKTLNCTRQEVESWHQLYLEGKLNAESAVGSPMNARPAKRGWLLEDYPHLVSAAQNWVKECFERCRRDPSAKPYKIIEFQAWCNDVLLIPLFQDPTKRASPISHSTARSWLHKLGYYERLEEYHQTQAARSKPSLSPLPLRTRTQSVSTLTNVKPVVVGNAKLASPKLGQRKRAHTVGGPILQHEARMSSSSTFLSMPAPWSLGPDALLLNSNMDAVPSSLLTRGSESHDGMAALFPELL